MSKTINIMLTTGETLTREYAGYSIEDKVLIVSRKEKVTVMNKYIDNTDYLPFELRIPMKYVMALEEVEE